MPTLALNGPLTFTSAAGSAGIPESWAIGRPPAGTNHGPLAIRQVPRYRTLAFVPPKGASRGWLRRSDQIATLQALEPVDEHDVDLMEVVSEQDDVKGHASKQ